MGTTCSVEGCESRLKNAEHSLCRMHWKMDQEGGLRWHGTRAVEVRGKNEPAGDETGSSMLSSTKLGEVFGLPATRVNLVLQELGWIERFVKGWVATEQGKKLGAEVRESKQRGVPYVVWPPSMARNAVLVANLKDADLIAEQSSEPDAAAERSERQEVGDFRARFPGTFRATDGHVVRSRAEALIDTWLYMQKIVHAVERRLPINEEAYCDFYVPDGKVYIEYWGMENDPKYAARMEVKKAIYAKSNLNLVELHDDDIKALDDILPRKLLKYGIDCT